jgi:hypothetical protein
MGSSPKDLDINTQCDYITSCLEEFECEQQLIILLRANDSLQELRELYRKDSRPFSSYIKRLKELTAKLNNLMCDSEDALLFSYRDLLRKQKTIKMACDLYKQALIEVFKERDYSRVKLANGSIIVKKTENMTIPKQKTKKREELFDLLQKKGYWEELIVLSTMLLKNAINSKFFTPEDEKIIRTLCSIKKSYYIMDLTSSRNRWKTDAWKTIVNNYNSQVDRYELVKSIDKKVTDEEESNLYENELELVDDEIVIDEEESNLYESESELVDDEILGDAYSYARSDEDGWFYSDIDNID